MPNHPNVRHSRACPFCNGGKDEGALACWPCYRAIVKPGRGDGILAVAEELLVCDVRLTSLLSR